MRLEDFLKKCTPELQSVIKFMTETLMVEFPMDRVSLEHLFLAILDTENCHANMIIGNYLESDIIGQLSNVFSDVLKEKRALIELSNSVEKSFDAEVMIVLHNAEKEMALVNNQMLGSEHILLSMLNGTRNCRLNNVLQKVGLDYNKILKKCQNPQFIEKLKEKKKLARKMSQQASKSGCNVKGDASRKHEFIDKCTTCLNDLAERGTIDKLIGRETELKKVIEVLNRRKKNNCVLIGKAGVGKTAIVYGLAHMINEGNVPMFLENKKIYMLNAMALISGTQFRGMFEERIKGLFDELSASKDSILFIDDVHTVLRSTTKDKDTDMSGFLGQILSQGEVQVIATTDEKGYRNSMENNPSISSKFQKMVVDPLSTEEAFRVVTANKKYYEKFHNVTYSDEVIRKAIKAAKQYINDRQLPDSVFDVIDTVGAKVSIQHQTNERELELKKMLFDLRSKQEELMDKEDLETLEKLIQEEESIINELAEIKKTAESQDILDVTENDIYEVISEMTNIPISKMSVDERKQIRNINEILKQHVIGQDEAVDILCNAVKRKRVGLADKNSPMVALLIGESGVGKSLVSKKLAEEVYGSEKCLVRLDMSEFSEKSSVSKLIGASQGYIGFEQGGMLTEAIKHKQHCVLLLDEIEKADKEVYNLFLQVFDEGRLTDNMGQTISFKDVIILMTSNVGVKQASELGTAIGFEASTEDKKKDIIEKELKKKFAPEFINRINNIVYFNPLSDDDKKAIVRIELNKFRNRVVDADFDMIYTDNLVEFIFKESSKEKNLGARPIKRVISKFLEDKLTDEILKNDFEKGHVFNIDCVNDEIVIKTPLDQTLCTFLQRQPAFQFET